MAGMTAECIGMAGALPCSYIARPAPRRGALGLARGLHPQRAPSAGFLSVGGTAAIPRMTHPQAPQIQKEIP